MEKSLKIFKDLVIICCCDGKNILIYRTICFQLFTFPERWIENCFVLFRRQSKQLVLFIYPDRWSCKTFFFSPEKSEDVIGDDGVGDVSLYECFLLPQCCQLPVHLQVAGLGLLLSLNVQPHVVSVHRKPSVVGCCEPCQDTVIMFMYRISL